jgi:hypothetical protein
MMASVRLVVEACRPPGRQPLGFRMGLFPHFKPGSALLFLQFTSDVTFVTSWEE